jgi:hypothetical protein
MADMPRKFTILLPADPARKLVFRQERTEEPDRALAFLREAVNEGRYIVAVASAEGFTPLSLTLRAGEATDERVTAWVHEAVTAPLVSWEARENEFRMNLGR